MDRGVKPGGDEVMKRSPDGAQRNPGAAATIAMPIPDFASLHPGYMLTPF